MTDRERYLATMDYQQVNAAVKMLKELHSPSQ